MSKFIDKLDKLAIKSAPEPMGFRLNVPKQKEPGMLLVGSINDANAEGLTERMAGADAGLLYAEDVTSATGIIKKLRRAIPDVPWGVHLSKASGGLKDLAKAGCDFLVFPPATTPLSATIEDKEMGRVLELEGTLGEGMLRTVNELPIDAMFLASEESSEYVLTWRHLMLFQRLANHSDKPLVVCAPPGISASELQALLEADVKAIIVEAGKGETAGRLKEISGKIARLSPPSPRKKDKLGAVLPRISLETSHRVEEEEEDDEEE